jgi:hypothetical protein
LTVLYGVTLDTGALVALERSVKRMRQVYVGARAKRIVVTVPAVVLIEWWRGGRVQHDILAPLTIEKTTERIAKTAGEAIAAIKGATAIDAAVMASAALRGDLVYTSDIDDLQALQTHFPNVRLMRAT